MGYSDISKPKAKLVLWIVDNRCHDTLKICIYAYELFITVAFYLVKPMQLHDLIFGKDSENFSDFYVKKGNTPGKFKLEPVSVDDVHEKIRALDARKSTGQYNLSSRF